LCGISFTIASKCVLNVNLLGDACRELRALLVVLLFTLRVILLVRWAITLLIRIIATRKASDGDFDGLEPLDNSPHPL